MLDVEVIFVVEDSNLLVLFCARCSICSTVGVHVLFGVGVWIGFDAVGAIGCSWGDGYRIEWDLFGVVCLGSRSFKCGGHGEVTNGKGLDGGEIILMGSKSGELAG